MTQSTMTLAEIDARLEKLSNELLYSEAAPNLTLWIEEAELRAGIRNEIRMLEEWRKNLSPTIGGKEA